MSLIQSSSPRSYDIYSVLGLYIGPSNGSEDVHLFSFLIRLSGTFLITFFLLHPLAVN